MLMTARDDAAVIVSRCGRDASSRML